MVNSLTFQVNNYELITKLKSMFDNVVLLQPDIASICKSQNLMIVDTKSIEYIKTEIIYPLPPPISYKLTHRVIKKEFIKKLQARQSFHTNITFIEDIPIIFFTNSKNEELTLFICTNEPAKGVKLDNIENILVNFRKYIK